MVSLELNDKIWFTLGIVYIVLIQHIVLCAPELMPLFYITVVGALVFYRFLAYKSCKWGWFLVCLHLISCDLNEARLLLFRTVLGCGLFGEYMAYCQLFCWLFPICFCFMQWAPPLQCSTLA